MEQGPFIDDKFNLNKFFEKIGISKLPKAEINWTGIREKLNTNPGEAESIFKNTFGEKAYQKLVEQLKSSPSLMADVRDHASAITDQIAEDLKEQFKESSREKDGGIGDAIAEEIMLRLLGEVVSAILSSL